MIEHFFLNAVNREDDRMVCVELTHHDRCLVAVYHKASGPVRQFQECQTEAEICQLLQKNGCEEPLVLLDNIRQFAREHGAQFKELPFTHQINLQADQVAQEDDDRPTYCPEA